MDNAQIPDRGLNYSNLSDEYFFNCTNDYCASEADYRDMIIDYIKPVFYEWVLVALHIIVLIIGVIGNLLVCIAVYRNRSMRTVVNYFLVNLAFADFLVLIICLPPTVLWDTTETWFFGSFMCKVILYFQNVSVTVSILTLTFISIDRWYAICHPLKFHLTTKRALNAILIIWIIALIFDIPELIFLDTKAKLLNSNIIYFTQCEPTWSRKFDTVWISLKMVFLYVIPLCFMTIAYMNIIKTLWKTTEIESYTNNKSRANNTDVRIRSRRKAAKMLVWVVVMFAICYFPVHLLSLIRLIKHLPQNDFNTAIALMSHWLCYANSAVNPIIYNIMNSKYRKEFNAVFHLTYRTCNVTTVNNENTSHRRNTFETSSLRTKMYKKRVAVSVEIPSPETIPLSNIF